VHELEPSWERVIRVWWLIAWRNVAGSIVIGAVIGGIVGLSAFLAGVPIVTLLVPIRIVAVIAAVLWTGFVVRSALRKRYRGFRIAIVELDAM